MEMTGNWSNDQLIAIVVLGLGGPVLGLARGANRTVLGGLVAGALGLIAVLGALRGHSALMWLPAATLGIVHFAASAAAQLRKQSDVLVRLQAAVFASVGPLVAAFLAW